ncbi:hypothetical protein HJG60_009953 [Phyllostomus discolor]|uniref:Uncharacterized protein n=1 Tax=Phyllostomus discolor TaxID=89673 RepID=A0A834BCR9_9CHIR|nr:hypothetical protein HJG60_009953 [Phyllostomus discolor]
MGNVFNVILGHWRLYYFSVATLTNYHKFGGLKQQKPILSQFWRPEAQNHAVGEAVLPGGLRGQSSHISSSSWWLSAFPCLWPPPFNLCSAITPPLLCVSLPRVSVIRILVTGARAHWDNPA